MYLRNSLTLQTNGESDTISFERSNISPFDSLALNPATILPGAGDDLVEIGNGVAGIRVDFRSRLSIVDTAGTDTINSVTTANLFSPGSKPEISGFENTTG